MALIASAVVTPRFPILAPVDPYLYVHLSSQLPSIELMGNTELDRFEYRPTQDGCIAISDGRGCGTR